MSTSPSASLRLIQATTNNITDQATALRLAGEALARLGQLLEAMGSQTSPTSPVEENVAPGWIVPEEAAAIAGLDLGTGGARRRAVVRIYSWARSKSWATRPNARTLLIDEARFRRWLDAHRDNVIRPARGARVPRRGRESLRSEVKS